MNFPFTKITIGDWTQATASSGDLMAKCYFGKRQLVWELLVEVQRESKNKKLKKKMEIQWASILSLKASQGILEVEVIYMYIIRLVLTHSSILNLTICVVFSAVA